MYGLCASCNPILSYFCDFGVSLTLLKRSTFHILNPFHPQKSLKDSLPYRLRCSCCCNRRPPITNKCVLARLIITLEHVSSAGKSRQSLNTLCRNDTPDNTAIFFGANPSLSVRRRIMSDKAATIPAGDAASIRVKSTQPPAGPADCISSPSYRPSNDSNTCREFRKFSFSGINGIPVGANVSLRQRFWLSS